MNKVELERELDAIDNSSAVECMDNNAFYELAHRLNNNQIEAKEQLETVLYELKRINDCGDDGLLSSTIYTDMNTIPQSLRSSLFWITLHAEGAYKELGGNLEEL